VFSDLKNRFKKRNISKIIWLINSIVGFNEQSAVCCQLIMWDLNNLRSLIIITIYNNHRIYLPKNEWILVQMLSLYSQILLYS